MEIIYKNLQENEISRELFRHFVRHQTVVKCRRKENGKWIIKDDPIIDDWSEADYKFLVSCLRNTAATGGLEDVLIIAHNRFPQFVNHLQRCRCKIPCSPDQVREEMPPNLAVLRLCS